MSAAGMSIRASSPPIDSMIMENSGKDGAGGEFLDGGGHLIEKLTAHSLVGTVARWMVKYPLSATTRRPAAVASLEAKDTSMMESARQR